MERREFLQSVAVALMFPFVNEEVEKGHWELDRVKDGRIVFLRYNDEGSPTASCIVGGGINDWTVRKAVWGGQIRFDEDYTDRAEALEEAREWMAEN